MKRLLPVLVLAALTGACGSSSTAPTTPPPATRIITVSGDLAFGNLTLGDSLGRNFTIGNSGNATLTFTSISFVGGSGSDGFSVVPTSGTVLAGSTVSVNIRFTPTAAQFYTNVLTVIGDQTSGAAAINVSGTGVKPAP
jgi:hypothetical protein